MPFLILKGLPLAQAYYGDLGLRVLCDLDLMTKAEDFKPAVEIFGKRGMFRITPIHSYRTAQRYSGNPPNTPGPPRPCSIPTSRAFRDLHTQPWRTRWHGFRVDCKLDLWPEHGWQEMGGVLFRVPSEGEDPGTTGGSHYAFNASPESNARLVPPPGPVAASAS